MLLNRTNTKVEWWVIYTHVHDNGSMYAWPPKVWKCKACDPETGLLWFNDANIVMRYDWDKWDYNRFKIS